MKKVAILCGGQSPEHEVSLLSASSIFKHMDRKLFSPELVGITKAGELVTGDKLIQNDGDPEKIHLNPQAQRIEIKRGQMGNFFPDVVFPIIHGTTGEDGVLQGLLQFFGFAYVGAKVKASAVGMDKDLSKILVQGAGLKVAPFLVLKKGQIPPKFSTVQKQLGPLVFVKPANSGSSVGVSRCAFAAEFDQALEYAYSIDTKILVETAVKGREIEIGVLEQAGRLTISKPSEICPRHEFYSYEAKYVDADGAELLVPAPLSLEKETELRGLAAQIFQILELSSMARVDFFLNDAGEFIFNEVNTLPGFTSISMYPRMFQASGLAYSELLTALVENAI